MIAVYLLCSIAGVSAEGVGRKLYSQKSNGESYGFNAASAFMGMLLFAAVSGFKLQFNFQILPYAVAATISYCCAVMFYTLAVSCGTLSITSIIYSCALVMSAVYGIVFLDEPLKITLIIGIILLVVAFIFMNRTGEHISVNLKWMIFMALAFFGNAFFGISLKAQQINFNGSYKSEMMITVLATAFVIMLCGTMIFERRSLREIIKPTLFLGAGVGAMNFFANYFSLLLATIAPISMTSPMISAGALIGSLVISITVFKEKLSRIQTVGAILGIISVVLFSI